jgi:catechol 2,3-dioxygenase-like lactoylglutathione lyase family enzyme
MEFNKLVPELSVSDFQKSLDFYTRVLGFKLEYQRQDHDFAFLSFQGSQLMIEQAREDGKWRTGKLEKPFGRGLNLQIEISDLKPLLASLEKNHWPIAFGPEENSYSVQGKELKCRELLVKDPDGFLLRFSQEL